MRSLRTIAIAAAATALLTAHGAHAADLLPPPPIEEYGGWYLRGDIGMSNQRLKGLTSAQFADPQFRQWLDRGGFDSAPIFGLGIGYRHNSWFRWDATGEYRGKAGFNALDLYDFDPPFQDPLLWGTNDYRAKKSEWLFLLNAYLDLGTWKGITPFVGAGLGASRNTISHFRDFNIQQGVGGYAASASKWNFAWALHAGVAYDVTPNFTIELAYRYLHLGDARTGAFPDDQGQCIPSCAPVVFKRLTSHDLKLGVRVALADMGVSHWTPPPVYSKY